MGTHYHVCYDLQAVKRALAEDKHESLFLTVDDRPATKEEILDVVIKAMAKGYEVLPPCDNVNSKGHCAGHEEKVKKKGYYVYVPEDDGVSIAVVATSSKEAKKIGYKYLYNEYDADFLEVRVKWKRDANVEDLPVGIEENYLTGLKRGIYGFIFGKCDICGEKTIVELYSGEVVCKFCRENHCVNGAVA